nr:hypothetical protein [Mesorhizobium metallidurans]
MKALYLSRSTQTALEEYKQRASIVPAATLAAYLQPFKRTFAHVWYRVRGPENSGRVGWHQSTASASGFLAGP